MRERRTELQMQYAQLILPGNCPDGIYINALDNLEKWDGVIFIRRGYYQGCILGFSITFPVDYPHRAPIVYFEKGSIVHPLVDPSNDRLSLSSAFPAWNAQSDNVTKLLFFLKGVFKTYSLDKLNDGLVVNTEAWRLYRFNRPVFAKLAEQCAAVSSSSSTLYGRGIAMTDKEQDVESRIAQQQAQAKSIPFRELNEAEMQDVRRSIFG